MNEQDLTLVLGMAGIVALSSLVVWVALRRSTRQEMRQVRTVNVNSAQSGSTVYISNRSTPGGRGTPQDPYSIGVLAEPQFAPGSQLIILPGMYFGRHNVRQYGHSSTPIVIKAYGAVFDSVHSIQPSTMNFRDSRDVELLGARFTSSSKQPATTGERNFKAIEGGKRGVHLRDLLLFNTGGIGGGPDSLKDSLLLYVGNSTKTHSVYWQNDGERPKEIVRNVFYGCSGYHIHAWSTYGQLKWFDIRQNVFVNPSILGRHWGTASILVGSIHQPATDIGINDNIIYHDPAVIPSGKGIRLGYNYYLNGDARVVDNTIIAHEGIRVEQAFSGLELYTNDIRSRSFCIGLHQGQNAGVSIGNELYTGRDGEVVAEVGDRRYDFDQWVASDYSDLDEWNTVGNSGFSSIVEHPGLDRFTLTINNPTGLDEVRAYLPSHFQQVESVMVTRVESPFVTEEYPVKTDMLGQVPLRYISVRMNPLPAGERLEATGYGEVPTTFPAFGVFQMSAALPDAPPPPEDPPDDPPPETRIVRVPIVRGWVEIELDGGNELIKREWH